VSNGNNIEREHNSGRGETLLSYMYYLSHGLHERRRKGGNPEIVVGSFNNTSLTLEGCGPRRWDVGLEKCLSYAEEKTT
jgi:hypothetical protein